MSKIIFIFTLLALKSSQAQLIFSIPDGGGEGQITNKQHSCLSPEKRLKSLHVTDSIANTLDRGFFTNQRNNPSFIWPVAQASGFNNNNIYAISNFVDHDPASGSLLDYNCGQRTYDLTTGYNHKGLDIYLWPFKWHMVNEDQAIAVASEDGLINWKVDGNPHTNCDFSNPTWNAVYLIHADGSRSWYGHLKNGSLTTKNIGDFVTKGEYLGVIASSGSSTGPHLHFEVYDSLNNLVDPYSGPCNSMNTSSWWINQPDYFEPRINTLYTHFAPPQFNSCPIPAVKNDTNCFSPGSTAYFAAYFRDQRASISASYQIKNPNGAIFSSWTHNSSQDYTSSYWYWTRNIPNNAVEGQWTFEVRMLTDTVIHYFDVSSNCSQVTSSESISVVDDRIQSYPNPSNGFFHLKLPINTSENYDLQMIDALGRDIVFLADKTNSSKQINLHVPSYTSGIYFLIVKTKRTVYQTSIYLK